MRICIPSNGTRTGLSSSGSCQARDLLAVISPLMEYTLTWTRATANRWRCWDRRTIEEVRRETRFVPFARFNDHCSCVLDEAFACAIVVWGEIHEHLRIDGFRGKGCIRWIMRDDRLSRVCRARGREAVASKAAQFTKKLCGLMCTECW